MESWGSPPQASVSSSYAWMLLQLKRRNKRVSCLDPSHFGPATDGASKRVETALHAFAETTSAAGGQVQDECAAFDREPIAREYAANAAGEGVAKTHRKTCRSRSSKNLFI